MLTFSHQRPNIDYVLCRIDSGSFLLFYIWQVRDWHRHTLHFSIQALALLYSIRLPVPSWTAMCPMCLVPVRRHWWSSYLLNGQLSGLGSREDGSDFHDEDNSLLAWLSPGASLWINFRHTNCTWNISKVLGQPVIYLQFWPLSKGTSLLTSKKVVVMFEHGLVLQMVVVAPCSLFIPGYLFIYFANDYRHKENQKEVMIHFLESLLQESNWLELLYCERCSQTTFSFQANNGFQ